MFGLGDMAVSVGFLLTILSSLLCIVYGIVMWGRKEKLDIVEEQKEKEWAKEEKKIEEEIL